MMIIDAIRSAATEQVVYVLLRAYLEAVDCLDATSGLPARVKRLPIARGHDVRERARLLHGTLKTQATTNGKRAMIQEAADVFNAAWARLRVLDKPFRMDRIAASRIASRFARPAQMRPHVPFAIGCLALALVCSMRAIAR